MPPVRRIPASPCGSAVASSTNNWVTSFTWTVAVAPRPETAPISPKTRPGPSTGHGPAATLGGFNDFTLTGTDHENSARNGGPGSRLPQQRIP